MKVIKKGDEKTYKITCQVCNSDLEYTDSDVFFITEEKRGSSRVTVTHLFGADEEYVNICKERYKCVICPMCHNTIKSIDFSAGIGDTIRWERVP